jgi:hypothetical protein
LEHRKKGGEPPLSQPQAMMRYSVRKLNLSQQKAQPYSAGLSYGQLTYPGFEKPGLSVMVVSTNQLTSTAITLSFYPVTFF